VHGSGSGWCRGLAQGRHIPSSPTWQFCDRRSTGHCRLGWATSKAELQAPVGFDAFGFSYRDAEGSKVSCDAAAPSRGGCFFWCTGFMFVCKQLQVTLRY
jgi:hypothetical protein